MTEEWKYIYRGLYQVSSDGRVRSTKTKRELSSAPNKRGYLQVVLCDNGRRKCYRVHRLVALAFIPNPDNLPQVNHIDENKINNHVSNLNWMTNKENANWGTSTERTARANARPIYALYEDGTDEYFWGMSEAARLLGAKEPAIFRVLAGGRKSTRNIYFEYAE